MIDEVTASPGMRRLNILVAVLADANSNPRPNRLIQHLCKSHDVTVLSWASEVPGAAASVKLDAPNKSLLYKASQAIFCRLGFGELHNRFNRSWRQALEQLAPREFDFIFCHDLNLMPLLVKLTGNHRLFLDLREFYPEQFAQSAIWRVAYKRHYERACAKYLPVADQTFTVSHGLAKAYEDQFSIRPEIWMSLPEPWEGAPGDTDGHSIRIIHHGGCMPAREIERMIEMMDYVDGRFQLDLMLTGQGSAYYKQIQELIETRANVSLIDPVPYEQILPTLSGYDIGIYICPPANFNLTHALPNKFFEFIQARLCLVLAPSLEMKRLLDEHQVGMTCDSFAPESLAQTLNALTTEDINRFKQNSHRAAQTLNVQSNNRMVDKLLGLCGDTESAG